MTGLRRFLLILLALIVLIGTASWWLLSTESGTRFLFARAGGFLPDALTITEVSGTLRTQVRARGIRWQDAATDARVEQLEVSIDLWQLLDETIALGGLRVDTVSVTRTEPDESDAAEPAESLEVSLPIRIHLEQGVVRNVQLNINGARRQIDSIEIAAEMEDADLQIHALQLNSDWLALAADGSLRISGRLPVTANIDWQYFEQPELPLAGRLEIGGDLDGLAIEHALRLPVEVQSTGELSFGAQGVFADLESRWETLRWQPLNIESRRGVLSVTGTPAAFDVSLSALASIAGVPETTINAEAQMSPDDARSVFIDASNTWGRSEIRGSASWRDAIAFDLEFGLDELDVQSLAPQLSGVLAAKGRTRGEIIGESRSIEVQIETLDGTLNDYLVSGSARLNIDDQLLRVEQLLATVGGNSIAANGSFGDVVNITGSLQADSLEALHPDLQGAAEATVTLRGASTDPTINLQLNATDLVWQDKPVDLLTLDAVGTATSHTVDISTRAFSTELALQLGGGLQSSGWHGDIRQLDVTHPRAGRWRLESPAAVSLVDASMALRKLCLLRTDGEGAVCANVAGGSSTAFDVSIERLPVALLPLPLPASIRAQGDIYASLEGELTANLLNANAMLEVREAQVDSSFDDETLTTRFSTMRLDAQVEENRVRGRSLIETQEGSLEIDASVANIFDSTSAVDGTAKLDIPDIAQLSGLIPALASPVGKADGTLRLAGSLARPEVTGAIQLQDGAFGIRAAGVRIENVAARVAQDAPGSLALQASATSGEGTLALSGNTSISETNQLTTTLALTGSRFELLRTPDLQAIASPDVTVIINESGTALSGELGIPEASVRLLEIPASAARVSPDAVIRRSGETDELTQQRPINVDVRTVLGEQVKLSAFGLNTNLRGNLQLRGDANKVINGFGRVSLIDGRYKAYGQELEIQRGELIFNGPLNRPQLDVRAVRNTPDVIAGIQVRGTPDALQSDVFSQPALRDIEALSYLLTGRPLNQENRDGDLLGDAAFALGLTGAGQITSRVRSSLGLDTLAIQGGADDGRIVAGKRLNDRLLVEYGYGLVDRLGTLLLRYQLNERLVLESRTGIVSNLDLVYRVRKQ